MLYLYVYLDDNTLEHLKQLNDTSIWAIPRMRTSTNLSVKRASANRDLFVLYVV